MSLTRILSYPPENEAAASLAEEIKMRKRMSSTRLLLLNHPQQDQ
jgi:hypothetical protein